jgi:RNA polymerase sigma-70 factor (ECF subfamily)
MKPADSTSLSLLRRAAAHEPDAWRRMVALYSPLVRHWCRQARVPDIDVEDLSQEVFAAVSAKLESFRADRPGTTFRAWMRGVARHKIQDYLRNRREPAAGGSEAQVRLQQVPAPQEELGLSEGPDDIAGVYRRALDLVRDEFEAQTWKAFWKVAVEDGTPAEVAAELGMTPNGVRKAKSRVLLRLREEMGEVIA